MSEERTRINLSGKNWWFAVVRVSTYLAHVMCTFSTTSTSFQGCCVTQCTKLHLAEVLVTECVRCEVMLSGRSPEN